MRLNPLLLDPARGLAQLDIDLIRSDQEMAALDAESLKPFDLRRLTISRLWVLGAYELVRTIKQILRSPYGPPGAAAMLPRATALEAQFERGRVPLAKFETARRYPSDSRFAQPGLNPDRAVSRAYNRAWQRCCRVNGRP